MGNVRLLQHGYRIQSSTDNTRMQSLYPSLIRSTLIARPQPFSPDFFQVHSSTCSIIRDIYKKILGMVLSPGSQPAPKPDLNSLFHPSTFIHSSPLESAFSNPNPSNPKSPGGQSLSSHSMFPSSSGGADPTYDPIGLSPQPISSIQQDAFQALVAGELPADRSLIGDGQKLTPQVVELFLKVDAKLKVR